MSLWGIAESLTQSRQKAQREGIVLAGKMFLQILDIRPVVAQSVWSLTTDWTTGVRTPAEGKDFILACVQTSSDANLTF
jgi:hypothetical protein